MDFKALAAARYSVRKFKDEPVKKADIDLILEAARNAPTAGNRQPQRILVIRDKDALAKVDACTKYRFGAPLVFLICADMEACWTRSLDGFKSADIDGSVVASQMMFQAADLGLGTTWVGSFDALKTAAEFRLPEKLRPVAFLILGVPADDASPSEKHSSRLPLEKIVFYDTWAGLE